MPDFSFEKINYSVRPNKAVERRLLLQLLTALDKRADLDLSAYRYIGFGSIWFVDFSLVHRALGIDDMLSFEAASSREKRVNFNIPFECVKVKLGTYSDKFAELTWEKKQLIWLDYDGVLQAEMFTDLRQTVSQVPSKSIMLLSVNADPSQLREAGNDVASQEVRLRDTVGAANLPSDAHGRMGRNLFPELVGEIWNNAFENAVAERPGFTYRPLVNIAYADGVPMVTCGGMILSDEDAATLATVALEDFAYLAPRESQFVLSVPHLTPREKLRFDQLVPLRGAATSKTVKKKLGFELKDTEIESYIRHYLHYPLYGEYQF